MDMRFSPHVWINHVRGSLLISHSIHQCSSVGHLEDIAVAKSQQGKGLGKKIILALDDIAKSLGCYKTILDCGETNVPFYEKCGFRKKEWQMAHYFE